MNTKTKTRRAANTAEALSRLEGRKTRQTRLVSGQFVSVWTNGKVSTSCTLDPRTGALDPVTVNIEGLGNLEREYFIPSKDTPNRSEGYVVCPSCHEFIVKTVMVPDKTGKGLHEEQVCSNKECESK